MLGVALLIAMAAYYQYSAKPAPETLMEDVEVSKEKPQAVQAVALHSAVVASGGHVTTRMDLRSQDAWSTLQATAPVFVPRISSDPPKGGDVHHFRT